MRSASLVVVAALALFSCTVDRMRTQDAASIDSGTIVVPDTFIPDAGHPLMCDAGLIDCSGTCARVSADSMNCGSCGNVCPTGVSCSNGRCECHTPMISCDGICSDPMSDPEHCGTCTTACSSTQMCSRGECIVTCTAANHSVCVNTDASGARIQVCADTQNDEMNCGTCNTRCAGGATCTAGVCVCPAGQEACSGQCVDLMSDPSNCGFCLSSCGTGGTCVGGACASCGTGLLLCGSPAHCYNTQTSTLNCGSCGHACAGGAVCNAGVCECPGTASTDCGTGCYDLTSNPAHCGMCTHACATGAVCTSGACMCPGGATDCGSGCYDLMTNAAHCGSCTMACSTGVPCIGGVCMCAGTQTDCGTGCFDLTTTAAHCGACGHACPAGVTCMGGTCQCPSPQTDCPTGCFDLMTNAGHCGGCTQDCGPGGACSAGTCTCAPGFTMCSGSCVLTQSDRFNCGSCGHVCPALQACVMGACSTAPPTHYTESTPSATLVPFIDACAAPGHTTVLTTTDDNSTLVPLPFPFRYWATDLAAGSMINVSSNGFISMDGLSNSSLFGTIPSTGTPNSVIAPHWGDDYTSAMGICIATVGTAPNRQWVVEWDASYYCCTPGPILTYEVILSENSRTIDFVYQTMTGARSQTAGLEDSTGAMGIGGCGATTFTCLPTAGMRVRFDPTP